MNSQEPKWAQVLIEFLPVMPINVRHDTCYNLKGKMKGLIKLHNPGKFFEYSSFGSHFSVL